MHDIKAIRDATEAYVKGWSVRGVSETAAVVATILKLDAELRASQTALQDAQARRNDSSKLIGQAKGRKDEAEAQRLMAEVEALKGVIAQHFEAEGVAGAALKKILEALPNLAADDVPPGEDEDANQELRRWGEADSLPATRLNKARDHVDLGEALGLMDFEAAARMSGSRFVVLKGQLARLERAIGQFMLDLQTVEHGYTEVSPPLLVRDDALYGTGQLPKFKEDLFNASRIVDPEIWRQGLGPDPTDFDGALKLLAGLQEQLRNREYLWLIPTAEVPLTNLVREQITSEEALPLRYTALTPCFRSEAGASGKDTRGMIRQHQFYKVELVSITTPEQSATEHERMVGAAEAVLKRLELPFRTMLLCAGDMGFSACKTYDLEVWLPSQDRYREISSCSNCGDFQARRMDARSRTAGEKGTRYVHTLNGSGLAVGRTLVAIMENYQDEGGRIAVPDALKPYLPDLTHIG